MQRYKKKTTEKAYFVLDQIQLSRKYLRLFWFPQLCLNRPIYSVAQLKFPPKEKKEETKKRKKRSSLEPQVYTGQPLLLSRRLNRIEKPRMRKREDQTSKQLGGRVDREDRDEKSSSITSIYPVKPVDRSTNQPIRRHASRPVLEVECSCLPVSVRPTFVECIPLYV